MRSKKLARQLKKVFGREDVEANFQKLEKFLVALPSSEESSELQSLVHGMSDFCAMIDKSYAEMNETTRIAQSSLEIGSQELNEANRSLFDLNHHLDAMVNSLGQGFLLFGRDGVCLSIFSQACEDLLECVPKGRHIADVLNIPLPKKDEFAEWIQFLFEERLDFEDAAHLGKKTFAHSKGRLIQLEYKPVRNLRGQLELVVLIATDRTEERDAKAKAQELQAYANLVVTLLKDKRMFQDFLRGSRSQISELRRLVNAGSESNPVEAEKQVRRLIHTLKGNSGTYGIFELASFLNEIESGNIPIDDKAIQKVSEIFEHHLKKHADLIGLSAMERGPTREISKDTIDAFEFAIKYQNLSIEKLHQRFIEEFKATPVREVLARFDVVTKQAADRLGKRIEPLQFTGDNFSLQTDRLEDILNSLTHLFRNAITHGIESPAERVAKGKSPSGKILVAANVDRQNKRHEVVLRIQDDGAGIDVARLRSIGEKRGLLQDSKSGSAVSDQQILNLIFLPQVSTAENVTELAGRGVGLDAVRSSLEKVGGSVSVSSIAGAGTTFTVRFPLGREAGLEPSRSRPLQVAQRKV